MRENLHYEIHNMNQQVRSSFIFIEYCLKFAAWSTARRHRPVRFINWRRTQSIQSVQAGLQAHWQFKHRSNDSKRYFWAKNHIFFSDEFFSHSVVIITNINRNFMTIWQFVSNNFIDQLLCRWQILNPFLTHLFEWKVFNLFSNVNDSTSR